MGLGKKEWIILVIIVILFIFYLVINLRNASAAQVERENNILLILYTKDISAYDLGIKYFFRVSLTEKKRLEAQEYLEQVPGIKSARVGEYSIAIDRAVAFLETEIHHTVSSYLKECSQATEVVLVNSVDRCTSYNNQHCRDAREQEIIDMIKKYSFTGKCP